MKKVILSMTLFCAVFMVACGNAEVDKINKLVDEATIKTKAAETAKEVAKIATDLQKEMDKIANESGDKSSFGKSVDRSLSKYKKAATEKLAEFGIEL